jgi:hypothetical protein
MIPLLLDIFLTMMFSAYESSDSGVIFSHQTHFGERDIVCWTCHKVESSMSAQDKNMPGHDECSTCHSVTESPTLQTVPYGCRKPIWNHDAFREIIFPQTHLDSDPLQECLSAMRYRERNQLAADNYPKWRCFQCHME